MVKRTAVEGALVAACVTLVSAVAIVVLCGLRMLFSPVISGRAVNVALLISAVVLATVLTVMFLAAVGPWVVRRTRQLDALTRPSEASRDPIPQSGGNQLKISSITGNLLETGRLPAEPERRVHQRELEQDLLSLNSNN